MGSRRAVGYRRSREWKVSDGRVRFCLEGGAVRGIASRRCLRCRGSCLHTPMRCVAGCPREGPGSRVRAEWRGIMLCYVMYCVSKNSNRAPPPHFSRDSSFVLRRVATTATGTTARAGGAGAAHRQRSKTVWLATNERSERAARRRPSATVRVSETPRHWQPRGGGGRWWR